MVAMSLLIGTSDFNGAGMQVIQRAMQGEADWYAFLFKLLLTALTLGAGFKGGEIVPTFFVGATFGCVVGPLLGMDPSFAAAVGLVALFCGVINCPVASFTLSVELFGGEGVIFFGIASVIGYMLSGYSGLYPRTKDHLLQARAADDRRPLRLALPLHAFFPPPGNTVYQSESGRGRVCCAASTIFNTRTSSTPGTG